MTTKPQRAAQAAIVVLVAAAIAAATFGPRRFAVALLDHVLALFVILFVLTVIVVAVQSRRRS